MNLRATLVSASLFLVPATGVLLFPTVGIATSTGRLILWSGWFAAGLAVVPGALHVAGAPAGTSGPAARGADAPARAWPVLLARP